MDKFNLAQLTKHIVVKGVEDSRDPNETAQEAVRETLKTYLRGMTPDNPEVKQGVKEVARGAMTGLLLCNAQMPPGALAVLRGVAEVSTFLPHDPSMLMRSSIEGIAEMRLLLSMDGLGLIQTAIDQEYMGSGEVFRKYLEERGTRDDIISQRSRAVS